MRRKTREQFIADARKVHGDKYDYSRVVYVDQYMRAWVKRMREGTGLVDAGICHAELAGLRVDGYAVRALYSDFRAVCNEMSGDDLAWG